MHNYDFFLLEFVDIISRLLNKKFKNGIDHFIFFPNSGKANIVECVLATIINNT